MTRKNNIKTLSLATGTALALGLVSGSVLADTANPFGMSDLSQGYQVATNMGKCGEGKCGGSKPKPAEGKCGGNMDKPAEGKCGGSKSMPAEGKCGGSKPKPAEGKCGEGKCGGSK